MADDVTADELDITDELIAERRPDPGSTPPDMHPWVAAIVRNIDILNLWVGRFACLLLIPMLAWVITEVVGRKLFLAPTDYAYDISRMGCGAMFMLGAAYALMRGVHIRADFLYRTWSRRTRTTVDAALYVLFFFPAMIFFFWIAYEYSLKAWDGDERSMDTAALTPLAPARSALPLGAFFLVLQGVAELLRLLHDLPKNRRWIFAWAVPIGLFFSALFAILSVEIVLLNIQFFLQLLVGEFVIVGEWLSDLLRSPFGIVDGLLGGAADALNQLKGLGGLSPEMLGAVMIGVMLFAIFIGFPISFTLLFLGIVFGMIGFGSKLVFFLMTLQFNAVMLEETLAAVPLFVFMGIMMEQAGLMERLFKAVQLMFAAMRGSLYIAVLFVSVIFAAATGIVGASVTILGIMAAKTMSESGYSVRLAAGTITAGGTLGILIPPSIMLVVMGPVLEVPVTDLFAAAIVPGILMGVLYLAYALIRCWIDPSLGPPLPEDKRPDDWTFVVKEFSLGLVPPAALVGFALGSILFGWATPTEGAACGAFGALVLTLAYGRFKFNGFSEALIKTLEISVLILFLVAASNFFGAAFSRLGTPTMMTEILLGLDMSPTLLLIMIMVFIFLLGWPLEWVPIVLIIVPILIPLLVKMEVDLVWFGILVAVNLQTAWLSPPVALSAYFLKGVVPQWDLKDIYYGMMQFMVIQLIGLVLVFSFPQIALWLPEYIYGDG